MEKLKDMASNVAAAVAGLFGILVVVWVVAIVLAGLFCMSVEAYRQTLELVRSL